MTERSRRVVLLIDYDNLQICAARDTPGRDLQLPPVVQLAQRYGTVILARAYAEWNLSTERLAVYKAGIEPAFAPVLRTESDRSGKSLADTVMVAEGMDMLWTLSPEVVVLATSDKDLIPLVRVAKQRGAFVVVLGSDFTAIPLREMADEHVTYRQLITDTGVRYATEAGPGRQPAALPEPRRRRERTGRERVTTVAPATASAAAPTSVTTTTPTPSASPAPRVERETTAATAAAAAAAAAAEPVAPFTATAPGEADAQTSGRRRRRRGSRRRSDRLGLNGEAGEGLAGDDAGIDEPGMDEPGIDQPAIDEADIDEPEDADAAVDLEPGEAAEIMPTSSAAESLSDEVPQSADVEPAPPPEPEAEPAPRTTRRRTTRRRTTTAGTAEVTPTSAEVTPASADETAPAPAAADLAPPDLSAAEAVVPEESADILPAPPPDAASTNGNGAATDAPKPATRPRRVASASRGRTRRP